MAEIFRFKASAFIYISPTSSQYQSQQVSQVKFFYDRVEWSIEKNGKRDWIQGRK
jgi:hypothetical protein